MLHRHDGLVLSAHQSRGSEKQDPPEKRKCLTFILAIKEIQHFDNNVPFAKINVVNFRKLGRPAHFLCVLLRFFQAQFSLSWHCLNVVWSPSFGAHLWFVSSSFWQNVAANSRKMTCRKKLITYIGPSNLAAHRHVASRRSFYIPCVDWVRIRRLNAYASWKNHSVIFITDKLLGSLTGVPVRWHGGLAFKRPHFSVADWFCFHSDVFRFFGFAEKLSRRRWIGWVHLA